jgi:hypothetical protein|tara:strand:- start:751 stop:852 length:102 start_codon:yes stop_codon:yes gene_type:complete
MSKKLKRYLINQQLQREEESDELEHLENINIAM